MKKNKAESVPPEISDWREAVRKRPAMYTGSTGILGFEHLLKELFASFNKYLVNDTFTFNLPVSVIEAETISFEILRNRSGVLRFDKSNGRISANISENLKSGFDLAVLNALSLNYEFRLFDPARNLILEQIYRQGIPQSGIVDETEHSFETLEIKFALDPEIWEEFEIHPHFIAEIIKELAFLNEDRIFELKYSAEGTNCRIIYRFPDGLKELVALKAMRGWGGTLFETELEFKAENYSVDICFCFHEYSINEPFFKSFVNNHYTHEGGTHARALLSGIAKALKKFVKEHRPDDFFVITERTILSRLVGAVHLKIKRPSFYGSTKNKLNNREISKPISEFVFNKLYEKLEADRRAATDLIRHFSEIHWNRKWLKRPSNFRFLP